MAALSLVVLVAAFNGPISDAWYQSRQRHLAADLGTPRPRAQKGQALGVLQIPVIGLDLVIDEGDGPAQLRSGPGHRIGTPLPGNLGNSLIFGHRHGWGGPFAGLGKLRQGDQILVKTPLGQPTLYVVSSVSVVSQTDVRRLVPTDDHRLTLVTGTGGYLSTRRLVVTAVSGDAGRTLTAKVPVRPSSSGGSVVFNRTVALLAILLLAAVGAFRVLRSRYRYGILTLVMAPLVAAALLALLLDLDLLLPGLR